MNSRVMKGYMGSRLLFGTRYPHRVQNIMIREYAERNQFKYGLSDVETSIKDSCFMLLDVVGRHNTYEAIAFFSVYLLPMDRKIRTKVYQLVSRGIELHFVLEQQKITDLNAVDKIEDLLSVRHTLPNTPLSGIYSPDKVGLTPWVTFKNFLHLHETY